MDSPRAVAVLEAAARPVSGRFTGACHRPSDLFLMKDPLINCTGRSAGRRDMAMGTSAKAPVPGWASQCPVPASSVGAMGWTASACV